MTSVSTRPHSPHPPLLPYVELEDLPSDFPDRAKEMLSVIIASAQAYASSPPVWTVKRRWVDVDGIRFAQQELVKKEEGWRHHITNPQDIKELNLGSATNRLDPNSKPEIFAHSILVKEVPNKLSIGRIVDHMEALKIGRPGTYGSLVDWLTSSSYIDQTGTITDKGKDLLALLLGNTEAGTIINRHQHIENGLEKVAQGRMIASQLLTDDLECGLSSIATLIDNLPVDAHSAKDDYAQRSNTESNYIAWPNNLLPIELNPELNIESHDPRRDEREWINSMAQNASGTAWRLMSIEERVVQRIRVLARNNAKQWIENSKYDLQARWMTGWYPGLDIAVYLNENGM